jgi:hypothetical protein
MSATISNEAIAELACCIASCDQDAEDNENPDFSDRSSAIGDGLRRLTQMLGVTEAVAPLVAEYMDEHHAEHHDEEGES